MNGALTTILMASVGSGIGATVLDALDLDPALRRRLRVVGVNPIAEAASNFRCDRCYLAPASDDASAYLPRLRAIVTAERPRVVLACRDDVLLPLSRLAATLDPGETTVLVPSPTIIALANDKFAMHEFARRHGLAFAETAIDRAGLDHIERVHGYPMIAKPRGGHGSLGVSVVRRHAEAEAALGIEGLCLQPFIGGPDDLDALLPDLRRGPPFAFSLAATDMSATAVAVDRGSGVIAYGSWSVPLMILGEARRFEVDPDPDLARATADFVAALAPEGLFGPCVFQFRRDRDGRPVCFEVNARMGGVEAARTLLGFPFAAHMIAHFACGPLPPLAAPADTGRVVLRALADRLVESAEVARLERAGMRAAPASHAAWTSSEKADTGSADSGLARGTPRMSDPEVTIVLVSVGSAIGGTVLDAVERDAALRRRLRVVGVTAVAEAANNFRCDRCYLAPPSGDPAAFLDRLSVIVAAERPRLILACRDDVLVPLAGLAASVDPAETTVLVSSAAVSAIANDKYATHLFAQRHGLPFAETAIDRDGLDRIERAHGYPLIAKPRAGHGTIGVSIVRRRAEAEAALGTGGLCLQPFIGPPADLNARLPDLSRGPPLAYSLPGADASAANVVVDRGGRLVAFSTWKLPVLILGEPRRAERDADPALDAAARAFVVPLVPEGLFGPCAFQFRYDREGRPVCFEINARIGGLWSSRSLMGFPVIPHLIEHFAFGPRAPLPPPADTGRIVLRALADRLIDRAEVARLLHEGVWEPPG